MAHRQAVARNKRLAKLNEKTKYSYGRGAFYDEGRHRFVRYSVCDSSVRRMHNRRCRRKQKQSMIHNVDNICTAKGNYYRKMEDYWWDIL